MSTHIGDLTNSVFFQELVAPASKTATFTTAAIDLLTTDKQATLLVQVGTVGSTGPSTLDGKIQQSAATGSGWADITGATIAQVGATGGVSTPVNFQRDERYARAVFTVGGTAPSYPMSAMIAAQKKQL